MTTRRLALTCLAAAGVVVSVSAQQGPDRSRPPVLGTVPALKLPPIQKRTLTNGLPVWIVGMHEVPLVDITLILKSGATSDPAGKFGLANMTADMLDEGAGTRNALDLADAIDFLGATLATSSGFDSSTVHLGTMLSKLDQALPLMADVVLRPAFAANELDRVRKSRITTIIQGRDNPATIASLAFPRLLFGRSHRYGTSFMGTEASLNAITASDLKTFHDRFYQPSNAHLLVVGDITADAVLGKLEKAFGTWKNSGPVPKPEVPAAAQHGPREIYLIDKPGAPQSQIRIGWIGAARNTPDYFALTVLNTILGGSFGSRLNQNLREQHGYAYGASSAFDMRLMPGPFAAAAGVQTDKTVESLHEFFKELDGIHQPVPAEELTREKNLLALRFPGTFETLAGTSGHLSELVVYGLPETLFNEYVSKIQAVTAADLQRVAQEYLQSSRFAVVVVGDLSKIEKPIRDANIAPVTIVSIDDVIN
jgi:predicted Zn-dependent peptidase